MLSGKAKIGIRRRNRLAPIEPISSIERYMATRPKTVEKTPATAKAKKPQVAAGSFDKTDVPYLCAPFAAMPFGETA
jgi:hypothetical protein